MADVLKLAWTLLLSIIDVYVDASAAQRIDHNYWSHYGWSRAVDVVVVAVDNAS